MITAVIGHGRSPEGRGWGERIDACGRVIRMWNWHWQVAVDHGTRYDIGLIEVHKSTIADWREHNRNKPKDGYIASLLMRYRNMIPELPKDAILLDQHRLWLKQQRRQDWGKGETGNWELTRGGIAACWAIDTAKEGDELVLVGFDVIKAGIAAPVEQAFSPEYMASDGFFGMGCYVPGKTKEGNHDYPAERRLIEFLAARHAVKLSFAEDIWT